jgi:hypothetical protein
VLVNLAPDGTQFYRNGCGDNMFSGVLITPTTGTYTIQLTQSGTTVGTENFTLYDEPPDASASIIPGGGTVSLTTNTPGQHMSLMFSGTSGQRVSLLTQSNNYGGCPVLFILAPDGTQVYGNGCGDNTFSGAVVLPSSGTYTITLTQSGTTIGTENFTLYDVPPDVTGTTTIGSAAANYTITTPGQGIAVSFAGTAGNTATVLNNAVSTTPSTPCYKITTLKPDGVTVLRSDQGCTLGYSSGSLSLATSGTYKIVIVPTGTTIGTFSIGVASP